MIYNIYINISSAQQSIMSNHEGIILKLCCSEDMVRTVTSVNEDVTGVLGLRYPRTECPLHVNGPQAS